MAKKKGGGKNTNRRGRQPKKRSRKGKKARKISRSKAPIRKRKKKKSGRGFANSNYNKIKKYVWKKHGREFTSYRDPRFYQAVGFIYANCKVIGSKCTQAEIENYYADWKASQEYLKKLHPQIPFRLTASPSDIANTDERNSFYTIDNQVFQNATVIFPDYLWIVSPMLIQAKHSQFLPKNYDYAKHFQEWANWCNIQHAKNSFTDKYEPYYRFTMPTWSDVRGRWETEVYSCDFDGMRWSYGFVPSGDLTKDGKVELPPEGLAPAPPTPEAPKPPTVPPTTDALEQAKHKAELQKLEIQKLKLEITKGEQELAQKSIDMLTKEQTRIMSDIKEMKGLEAPKEVMDQLFSEYIVTSKKLAELKGKIG